MFLNLFQKHKEHRKNMKTQFRIDPEPPIIETGGESNQIDDGRD